MLRRRYCSVFSAALITILISACAALKLEQPHVTIVGFSAAPPEGLEARFLVKLKIANPNSIALPLAGMSNKLMINGQSLLKGVANNLPSIPAYGEEVVEVSVSTNLLSAPRFLLSFAQNPDQALNYEFASKIDLKGTLPSFNIVEKGTIPINSNEKAR